jgi:molybdopterin converting factor small subunit
MATGTVRFWAAARAAAGSSEATYDADTLGGALAALAAGHGPDLARVLGHCSFLVDGQRVGPEFRLPEGGVVEVLPPFAGG